MQPGTKDLETEIRRMDRTPWVGEHRGLRSSIPVWLELCFEETLAALSPGTHPMGDEAGGKESVGRFLRSRATGTWG